MLRWNMNLIQVVFDCLSNLDTNVKEDTIVMMDYEFDTGWIRFLFQSGYEC